jgi:hypothetical protein
MADGQSRHCYPNSPFAMRLQGCGLAGIKRAGGRSLFRPPGNHMIRVRVLYFEDSPKPRDHVSSSMNPSAAQPKGGLFAPGLHPMPSWSCEATKDGHKKTSSSSSVDGDGSRGHSIFPSKLNRRRVIGALPQSGAPIGQKMAWIYRLNGSQTRLPYARDGTCRALPRRHRKRTLRRLPRVSRWRGGFC